MGNPFINLFKGFGIKANKAVAGGAVKLPGIVDQAVKKEALIKAASLKGFNTYADFSANALKDKADAFNSLKSVIGKTDSKSLINLRSAKYLDSAGKDSPRYKYGNFTKIKESDSNDSIRGISSSYNGSSGSKIYNHGKADSDGSEKAMEALNILSAQHFPADKIDGYSARQLYGSRDKPYSAIINSGDSRISILVGDDYVEVDSMILPPDKRGQGYAKEWFDSVVTQSRKAGKKEIKLYASRASDMNGYYTWPRYGFDAELPPYILREARMAGLSARKVSDLMKTEEGRKWWLTNGKSLYMTFDLDENSLNSGIWNKYRKENR